MSFLKIVIISALILVPIGYYIETQIKSQTKLEYMLYYGSRSIGYLFYIDEFLNGFGINGFIRSIQKRLSEGYLEMIDKTKLQIEETQFDGVDVIIFDPVKNPVNRPAIIYYHGGGWSVNNARLYSNLTAEIALRLNTIVISVNYRKAPEDVFPAAFDDCLRATEYLFSNAATPRFHIDRQRIGLMGDSAGGNLVVAVAYHMMLRHSQNNKAHRPKLIAPLNPILQIADFNMPSFRDNINDLLLTKHATVLYVCLYAVGYNNLSECQRLANSNSHIDQDVIDQISDNINWKLYLNNSEYLHHEASRFNRLSMRGIKRMSELVLDARCSPLSALNDSQLGLLPVSYIFVSADDPLRDDGRLLWARLNHYYQLQQHNSGRQDSNKQHQPVSGVGAAPSSLIELEGFHAPFITESINLPHGKIALQKLLDIFQNGIL